MLKFCVVLSNVRYQGSADLISCSDVNTKLMFYVTGFKVLNGEGENVVVRGIFLNVSLDSPAKALWLQLKQFNGYGGCPKCKERGEQHIIDLGKGGKKRQCYIYPHNTGFQDGHCSMRSHDEVKEQALEALQNRKNGMNSVSSYLTIGIAMYRIIFSHQ